MMPATTHHGPRIAAMLCVVVLGGAAGAGCLPILPAMYASKLVEIPAPPATRALPADLRPPDDSRRDGPRGLVSASMGLPLLVRDDPVIFGFTAEGALSLWLHERYAVAATLRPSIAGVEGNLRVLSHETIIVGITHGFGLGVLADLSDGGGDYSLLFDFTGGVLAQFGDANTCVAFVAARYTYTTRVGTADEPTPSHGFGGALGCAIVRGRLRIVPEVAVGVSWAPDPDPAVTETTFFFVPGVTVGASFY